MIKWTWSGIEGTKEERETLNSKKIKLSLSPDDRENVELRVVIDMLVF